MTLEQRIEQRLAELTKQRAERKMPDDVRRSMPQPEADAYLRETSELDARMAAIRNAASAYASSSAILASDGEWLAFLNASRKTLVAELTKLTMPVRGSARQRFEAIEASLTLIDHRAGTFGSASIVTLAHTKIGELMVAAGYAASGDGLHGPRGWRGSIAEVEARMKRTCAERDKAVAQLDALLLSDAEREKREAGVERHRAALGTMNVRMNTDATGLVAHTKDGDQLPLDAMTAEQRAALEWFELVAYPPRDSAS